MSFSRNRITRIQTDCDNSPVLNSVSLHEGRTWQKQLRIKVKITMNYHIDPSKRTTLQNWIDFPDRKPQFSRILTQPYFYLFSHTFTRNRITHRGYYPNRKPFNIADLGAYVTRYKAINTVNLLVRSNRTVPGNTLHRGLGINSFYSFHIHNIFWFLFPHG